MLLLPALLLATGEALADPPAAPQASTKNPHVRQILRLYEDLEYEAALDLLSKAEQHPGNGPQERLWLELMQGVIHHSLHHDSQAEAALRHALQQVPDANLPIPNPSQTLRERFKRLQDALRQEQGLAQPPAGSLSTSPLPAIISLFEQSKCEEALAALSQTEAPPASDSQARAQFLLLRGILHYCLHERHARQAGEALQQALELDPDIELSVSNASVNLQSHFESLRYQEYTKRLSELMDPPQLPPEGTPAVPPKEKLAPAPAP